MSILPTYAVQAAEQQKVVSNIIAVPKEYGIDFATGKLTGTIVSGLEAIKVWVWACLNTERFRYPIYSWDYGASLERYIGQSMTQEYIETECETEIREALMVNPYITGISEFSIEFAKNKLSISLTVNTRFGNLEVEKIV